MLPEASQWQSIELAWIFLVFICRLWICYKNHESTPKSVQPLIPNQIVPLFLYERICVFASVSCFIYVIRYFNVILPAIRWHICRHYDLEVNQICLNSRVTLSRTQKKSLEIGTSKQALGCTDCISLEAVILMKILTIANSIPVFLVLFGLLCRWDSRWKTGTVARGATWWRSTLWVMFPFGWTLISWGIDFDFDFEKHCCS